MKNAITAFLAIQLGVASTQAQGVDVHVESDGSLVLYNHGDAPFSFDGYSIASDAGILDPSTWVSIQDAVASDPSPVIDALGSGSLLFEELSPTTTNLSEGSQAGFAVLQPGKTWSFGFPFDSSAYSSISELSELVCDPATTSFAISGEAGILSTGLYGICFIPEPSTLALASMLFVALFVLTCRESPRGTRQGDSIAKIKSAALTDRKE